MTLFDRFMVEAIFGRVEEMNLYLKYRPKTIDELDLAGVRKALADIVKANKTSHAYLLTGPRGAGKTSTARILARIVNCEKNGKQLGEPCNECSACKSILDGSSLDVIEIDAASNRGIDDIRELKEKIRLAPVSLSKKVYIIDEVHMLTTEAFNALLKTLEEPPKHSLFILCTTETHKVPETIVSRCTRIAFTKATPEEMVRSFNRVVKGEKAKASEEALLYLGGSVDGSFRDGVKVLDQVIVAGNEITMESIQVALQGVAGYSAIPLSQALVNKEAKVALQVFRESIESGVDLTYLLTSTMKVLRDSLLSPYQVVENPLSTVAPSDTARLVFMIDEVCRKVNLSSVPTLLCEMLIIEWCGEDTSVKRGGESPKKIEKPVSDEIEEKMAKTVHVEVAPVTNNLVGEDANEMWKAILSGLGKNNMALDTILSKARPGNIHGDELTVYVQYDFHRQQLMTEKNLAKFEAMISQTVGRPMKVKCEVKQVSGTIPEDRPAEEDLMSTAQDIFIN